MNYDLETRQFLSDKLWEMDILVQEYVQSKALWDCHIILRKFNINLHSDCVKNTHILALLPQVGGITYTFLGAHLGENVILVCTFPIYLLMASIVFFYEFCVQIYTYFPPLGHYLILIDLQKKIYLLRLVICMSYTQALILPITSWFLILTNATCGS